MDVKDLLENAKNLTDYEFGRRLESLVINNYKYKNLNPENRKLIMTLLKKYQSYLKRGIGISSLIVQREMFALSKNRIKLGIDDADLKDIQEILEGFEK